MISLPTNPPPPYHIGDVVKNTLRAKWYDSIFENEKKMEKFTPFIAPFKYWLFTPDTKILYSWILFRVKTIEMYNKFDLYSRTCADVSSIIEGVYFTVSYTPVAGIKSLIIIIDIASAKGMIIFR